MLSANAGLAATNSAADGRAHDVYRRAVLRVHFIDPDDYEFSVEDRR